MSLESRVFRLTTDREECLLSVPTTVVSQQEWQDAPDGLPQDPTYSWSRRHDGYTADELAGGREKAA